MIYLFTGEDRVKAEKEIKKLLGENYEIIDGENLSLNDLPSLFMGVTIFEAHRKILLRDPTADCLNELEKYLDTPHEIVVLCLKLDGRSGTVKELKKNPKIKFEEFKFPEPSKEDRFLSFNVYDEALRDGKKALAILKKAEVKNDPYMMLGSWASKAMKNFTASPTEKNKRVLKRLAKMDMLLKQSSFSSTPWLVLESFLLELKDL